MNNSLIWNVKFKRANQKREREGRRSLKREVIVQFNTCRSPYALWKDARDGCSVVFGSQAADCALVALLNENNQLVKAHVELQALNSSPCRVAVSFPLRDVGCRPLSCGATGRASRTLAWEWNSTRFIQADGRCRGEWALPMKVGEEASFGLHDETFNASLETEPFKFGRD